MVFSDPALSAHEGSNRAKAPSSPLEFSASKTALGLSPCSVFSGLDRKPDALVRD
jgi:hypothetical protein